MYLPEAAQIRDFLNRELQKHWKPSLVNVPERVRLVPDLEKYRLEDPFFTAQAKGMIPKHYSIYFDDEYVCGFDSTYLPEAVLLQFWRGVTKLYKEGTIHFDKKMYQVEQEIVDYQKKEKKRQHKEKIDNLNIPKEAKEVIKALDEKNEKSKGKK